MKQYSFKSDKMGNLTSLEIKTIMEHGKKFFELMVISPEAKQYLEYKPNFAKAMDTWGDT